MIAPLKWRPPLALLVVGVIAMVFFLPIAGMAVVVAVSREPSQIAASVYDNWVIVTLAVTIIVLLTLITGFVFWRGLTRPLRALSASAEAVALGHANVLQVRSYGTREIAVLAKSFATLVERLQRRSLYLETLSTHLAHEIRSPVTSIRGAAELLRDEIADMEPSRRERFIGNVISDTDRLTQLAKRMRELARANLAHQSGSVSLYDVVSDLKRDYPELSIDLAQEGPVALPISRDMARMTLGHLADNARRHGATSIGLHPTSATMIEITNNGEAISDEASERVFDPFFTTERATGSTGLGLAIVKALLESANGDIELTCTRPVAFCIRFLSPE